MEKIVVDYEPLSARVETAVPETVCLDWAIGDSDETAAVFDSAALTVTGNFTNNRLMVAPLETRSAIGCYDLASGRYTLQTPSQGVHFLRRLLAEPVLGIPEHQLRVVIENRRKKLRSGLSSE